MRNIVFNGTNSCDFHPQQILDTDHYCPLCISFSLSIRAFFQNSISSIYLSCPMKCPQMTSILEFTNKIEAIRKKWPQLLDIHLNLYASIPTYSLLFNCQNQRCVLSTWSRLRLPLVLWIPSSQVLYLIIPPLHWVTVVIFRQD